MIKKTNYSIYFEFSFYSVLTDGKGNYFFDNFEHLTKKEKERLDKDVFPDGTWVCEVPTQCELLDITPSQKKTIIRLRNKFLYNHSYVNVDDYEIKYESAEQIGTRKVGLMSYVIEVGAKKDEGTMASIVCRDRCHFFIGKRGKVTVPDQYSKRYNGY